MAMVHAEPESPQAPASPICDLSDDELHPPVPVAGGSGRKPATKRKSSLIQIDESKLISQENQALRRIVCSNCRCRTGSCRQLWRDDADAFQSLLKLRCRWQQVSKREVDSEASGFHFMKMILLRTLHFAFSVTVVCGDQLQQLLS